MDGMSYIDLAEDKGRWRAVMDTIMNLRVPFNTGDFRRLSAFEVGLRFMDLVVRRVFINVT
jgi:hypothetical protein